VTAVLGAGGMGEVYRAQDLKLDRQVAIKILPKIWLADPGRRARFEREARVLASLNHPNIAGIYGIEESAYGQMLVLELVEGATLADRIARGRLPVKEALQMGRQIADALAAAHERGIVHRDLKPANVQITPAGLVKVLDFGLATVVRAFGEIESPESAATALTSDGIIVGTAAYMSPEQARGLAVDKRTDVWAFGCLLYELLTGRPAFDGTTTTDILAAVLERMPDWERLPASVAPNVRRLVQRCLQKDPGQRLRDAGDISILIDDALSVSEPPPVKQASSTFFRRFLQHPAAITIASVLVVAVIAMAAFVVRRPVSNAADSMRLSISTPWPVIPQLSAVISPDGQQVAFVATGASGGRMLWVRALSALEGRALPGTEGAIHPFWSPDSRSIGFVAGNELKRIGIVDGSIQMLATTDRGGGTWNKDDVILFTRGFTSGLWMIPASGGTPTQVTNLDQTRGERSHAWPQFLPDDRHFLYFVQSERPDTRGVYLGSIDSPSNRKLLGTDFQAAYAAPGYLLFMRGETLMAQPFGVNRLELTGDAKPVAEGVWTAPGAGRAAFSASDNGIIAYMNATLWNTQLTWFDRHGHLIGALGPPDRYQAEVPEISPDGGLVAIAHGPWGHEQIGIIHTTDGTSTRVTFDGVQATNAVWSADGRRIMFGSRDAALRWTIKVKNASGAGNEEVLFSGAGSQLNDWSRDGRYAIYSVPAPNGTPDLWLLPLFDETSRAHPVPLVATDAADYQAKLSPDGRWIAYSSGETGREEVYIQSFPTKGSKQQVSPAGGSQARWRADGKELFYVAADNRLMAVAVTSATTLELGTPTPLFSTQLQPGGYSATGDVGALYDVAADGQRFLMNIRPADLGAPITVVTNWATTLKR
jgi:serine/threonine protein kinase/Tol biopolymer transport system component